MAQVISFGDAGLAALLLAFVLIAGRPAPIGRRGNTSSARLPSPGRLTWSALPISAEWHRRMVATDADIDRVHLDDRVASARGFAVLAVADVLLVAVVLFAAAYLMAR